MTWLERRLDLKIHERLASEINQNRVTWLKEQYKRNKKQNKHDALNVYRFELRQIIRGIK